MALTTIEPFGINSSNSFTFANVTATGNITGNFFIGNGSQLTGLPESYSNANVAAYLPTYSGNISADNITATTFTGNITGGADTASTVTASAQPNITSVGTLTLVNVTGNITGSYFIGNGSELTSITGANVTGQVPNALVAGTVYSAAQPNITSVGTLSSLSVSGNITGGNISTAGHAAAATLQTTGNAIIGGDLVVNGNTIQVNIDQLNVQDPIIGLGRGANNAPLTTNDGKDRGTEMWYYTDTEQSAFVGYQNSTGNIIAASNVSLANEIVTVNSYGNFVAGNLIGATVSVSGNVTASYVLGNGSELTSITGANVTGQVPNALVAGTVYTAAQPNITSVGTLSSLSVSGNITGSYFIGNGSQLTGLPESYSNANVAAYLPTYTGNLASLEGNVTTTANIAGSYFIGNGSQLTGIQAGGTTTFSSTAPASPSQGDIWIDADTGIQYIYFDDGTSSQWAEMEAQTSISSGAPLSAVTQSIIPADDVTYDLGSSSYRWRDIYLSGNTINLGGATIKTDAASGAIALIPEPTEANPNPSGMVVSPSGGITVVATTGGEVSGNAIANAASSPTAAPVPIDITTTAPEDGQALIWDAANSEFVPGNVSAGGGGATTTVYANIASLPLANVTTGSMAFVSSNNRLYLWNGTGWFNIALINTNPTITGGADPAYLFATDGTPIVLTLTASDPEGIPLTWSYEVTSGSLGNTATVSQADNVFTITPSTDNADAGAFEITFSASDGVNIGTAVSTFTLTFGSADPYYQQSILLSTTSTNNGTNNTFVDSSTNNATVTRYANTTQGAFGAFSPAGWGGYFDGTGDYLQVPSSALLTAGANDFTIECWVYPETTGTLVGFCQTWQTGGAWILRRVASNRLELGYNDGSNKNLTGTSTLITANAWNHVAAVRDGNTLKLFVNGVQDATTATITTSLNTAQRAMRIGVSGDTTSPFTGYISNVRYVIGTALYTTSFTPSTEPLTAVPNTVVLTLQNNRFVDNSTNNFTISALGDTKVVPFSPFSPTSPYATLLNGGSGYFDGTGDYLSVPYSTSAFDWWTSDYTIEAWVYPTSFTGWSYSDGGNIKPTLIGNKTFDTTEHYWGFGLDATGKVYFAYYNGASQGAGSSGTATLNAWNHIALVISGTLITVYLNGVGTVLGNLGGSIASSASVPLTIGAANNTYINGYVSGLRVVKGTAVYTENFTPPTAPPTAIANTSLLLNFTNANIYDQTGKVDAETVGDAKVSTAVVKYGDSSMYFDGTGDHVLMTPSLDYAFGTGNFTVECWVYITADTSATRGIWQNGSADSCNIQRNTSGNLQAWDGADRISTTPVSSNAWNHIAFSRASGTARIFVNGVVATSWSSSVNYTSTAGWVVGYTAGGTNRMTGYIQDFRITKGVARYTANFTPPTAQLGFNNAE